MSKFSRSKVSLSSGRIIRVSSLATTIILMLFCVLLPPAGVKAVESQTAKHDIPDLALLDQDGKRVLFYSQLLKGKVVAINFIYTTCAAFCTAQGATFSKLQALLGDELGKSVNLVTITTDPEVDTPERLKAWSVTFGVKPGWTMITGEKKAIDEILKALTGDTGRTGMHSPIVLIGNIDKGVWIRDYGLENPERLAATIEEMITGKQ
jgi:protein SCO1